MYLYVRVERPEVDPLNLRLHHSLDGVAAAATDADNLLYIQQRGEGAG